MRRGYVSSLLFVLLLSGCSDRVTLREISINQLKEKIKGGWAGQMIGVSFGAPTEFRYLERIIPESELPAWNPERVLNSIRQDDLYVEMTFAQVLDDRGIDASTEDFGAMFRDSQYELWHANLAARRALRRGIAPEESGTPLYNAHANDIDFQIESDFIGLMSPGLPVVSNDLCWRAGRVMNYGDGIYGGMFVAGMYSAAFFEEDVRRVVESGAACLPKESPYFQLISDLLSWSGEYADDWAKAWQLVEEKWNRRDPCPAGALHPFNIDAKLNGAYIALGLLYGDKDFVKTIEIATRAGQDSDCNPSNAAGVLGVMLGYESIPEEWKAGIAEIQDQKFDFTNYSFNEIVDSTVERAIKMVERNGGRIEGQRLLVKEQKPEAAALEIWDDYGSPTERIGVDDERWTWEGPWIREDLDFRGSASALQRTDKEGGVAEISFSGTGVIITGPLRPDGGTADIYLNGELVKTVDVYSDSQRSKRSEAIWHFFGLAEGEHSVRLETRGEPFGDSSGSVVAIRDLVVFR